MRTLGTVINTILFMCNLVLTVLSVVIFLFVWDKAIDKTNSHRRYYKHRFNVYTNNKEEE